MPHPFTFVGQHVRIGAAAAVRAAITGNEVWRHGAMKPAGKYAANMRTNKMGAGNSHVKVLAC